MLSQVAAGGDGCLNPANCPKPNQSQSPNQFRTDAQAAATPKSPPRPRDVRLRFQQPNIAADPPDNRPSFWCRTHSDNTQNLPTSSSTLSPAAGGWACCAKQRVRKNRSNSRKTSPTGKHLRVFNSSLQSFSPMAIPVVCFGLFS